MGEIGPNPRKVEVMPRTAPVLPRPDRGPVKQPEKAPTK